MLSDDNPVACLLLSAHVLMPCGSCGWRFVPTNLCFKVTEDTLPFSFVINTDRGFWFCYLVDGFCGNLEIQLRFQTPLLSSPNPIIIFLNIYFAKITWGTTRSKPEDINVSLI